MTNSDYQDDQAILANTPAQAKSLLCSLEQAAEDLGLYVNADKTEFMCFTQNGDIFSLSGSSIKLVDQFNNISTTESDVNIRIGKAWTTNDRSYENFISMIKWNRISFKL